VGIFLNRPKKLPFLLLIFAILCDIIKPTKKRKRWIMATEYRVRGQMPQRKTYADGITAWVEERKEACAKLRAYAKQKGVEGHLRTHVHAGTHEVDREDGGIHFMHEILGV
jgi:hypothetical protein